jgi:hypothetical protein
MEIKLSYYQALILNRAIDLFRERKIGRNTLIDDTYILQKLLAEWISVNSPISTDAGVGVTDAAVKTAATLAFNNAINDNRAALAAAAKVAAALDAARKAAAEQKKKQEKLDKDLKSDVGFSMG